MAEIVSLRKIFGETLEKLGAKTKNLVVIDSDLSNNLYTLHFAKSFPERHFSIGMSESAMVGMAAGFSVRKKIPFICAELAPLLGKAWDILKNAVFQPNLNIKIILSGSELTNCEKGISNVAPEALAILKSIPHLKLFTPSDPFELKAIMEFMLSDYGPTIVLLPQIPTPVLFDQNYQFKLDKINKIKQGEKILLISYGAALHETIKASKELDKRGISNSILGIPVMSPLNLEQIEMACSGHNLTVVIEQFFSEGSLGSLILEKIKLPEEHKIIKIGLENWIEGTRYEDALNKYQLNAQSIYEKIRDNWLTT